MAKEKKHKRSALSGKIINGRDVIMVEEASEYLKKQGFTIIPQKKEMSFNDALKKAIGFIFIAFISIPLISAQEVLLTMDFTQRHNQVIIGIMFIISLALYFIKQRLWSGTILLIIGILFALNSINLVISLLMLGIGVLIITSEE